MKHTPRYFGALVVLLGLVVQSMSGISPGHANFSAAAPAMTSQCNPAKKLHFVAGSATRLEIPLLVVLEWQTQGKDIYKWRPVLQQAAQYLKDATDGQATIGDVTVLDNACEWANANIRVYVHNTGIPDAAIGGLGFDAVKSLGGKPESGKAYPIGSIHLGRAWSEFGPVTGQWTQDDGFRTVVHELGHYAFYLYDEYYRYDDTSATDPRPAAFCASQRYTPGGVLPPAWDDVSAASIMYWEYNTHQFWHKGNPFIDARCAQTRQGQVWHRSDWQVIHNHYPAITPPGSAPGTSGSHGLNWSAPPRWLLGTAGGPGVQGDSYLAKLGGAQVLHEGVPYPECSLKLVQDRATGINRIDCVFSSASSLYPSNKLEIDGGNKGDVVRVTGVDPHTGIAWQAVQSLTGPTGPHPPQPPSLIRQAPGWYTNVAKLPTIDATPILNGPDGGLTDLNITVTDRLGVKHAFQSHVIDAKLYEAGAGPQNTPRSTTGKLLDTGSEYSGQMHLLVPPDRTDKPILDGALYLTPDVDGRPQQPINLPDAVGAARSAWALAYFSASCDIPSSFMGGHAPGDEGGIDSADGVVNVHLTGPALPGYFCAAFTSQPADLQKTGLIPLTAAYSIHGSSPVPAGIGMVVTVHYDRNLAEGNLPPGTVGWAQVVQQTFNSDHIITTTPLPTACDDVAGTASARLNGTTVNSNNARLGVYQVVVTMNKPANATAACVITGRAKGR